MALEARQKAARARSARSTAGALPSRRPKMSGARTKRFFVHWVGRMERTRGAITARILWDGPKSLAKEQQGGFGPWLQSASLRSFGGAPRIGGAPPAGERR